MTKKFTLLLLSCCLFTLPVFFNSCIKDTCDQRQTFRLYQPVYKTRSEVLAGIKTSAPEPIQRPGKIYVRGNYIYLNDVDRGIHIIDNSNPSSPRNLSFIPIPGNMDLAVKGNTLYADFYNNLVTIDVSDPQNAVFKNVMENMFPERQYTYGFQAQTDLVITDWIAKDTVQFFECDVEPPTFMYDYAVNISSFASSSSQTPFGAGGSMARFTITNERLYTVSNRTLEVLDISEPFTPSHTSSVDLGWGIETIYPFRNELFIGSQTGMFRYDVSNPDQPFKVGQFMHARACDPVIADNDYAYVTLRSGSACQGFSNQLDIIDLNTGNASQQYTLLKTYQMTQPHGLGKDGNLLFICDGTAGLKVYDASSVHNLRLLRTFEMDAYDVIPLGKRNLVVAKDGIYQFDYSNTDNIRLLSKVSYN